MKKVSNHKVMEGRVKLEFASGGGTDLWAHLRQCFKHGTCTVCPRSSARFYIVAYYIKWVTTSSTDGILDGNSGHVAHGWKKMGIFGEKNSLCDCSRFIKCFKQRLRFTCAPISELPSDASTMNETPTPCHDKV